LSLDREKRRTPMTRGLTTRKIRLTLLSGKNHGYVFDSGKEIVSLGRGSENDLTIPDRHVSGRHGEIRVAPDGCRYRDLRSTNGSMIQRADSRIVLSPETGLESDLRAGDRIILGDANSPVLLKFELLEATAEPEREKTLVAACELEGIADLNSLLQKDQPTLTRLYHYLEELQPLFASGDLFRRTGQLILASFAQTSHVGIWLKGEEGEEFLPVLSECRAAGRGDEIPLSRQILR